EDRPLVTDQEQLPVGIDAERGDLLRRFADLPDLDEAAAGLRQGPDPPRLEVTEDVGAVEGGVAPPAIDVPAGDRAPVFPAIGQHRRRVGLARAAVSVRERREAFVDVPTVVLARADDRDLLEDILADVAGPQVAAGRVEAESPGHANPRCPDLS